MERHGASTSTYEAFAALSDIDISKLFGSCLHAVKQLCEQLSLNNRLLSMEPKLTLDDTCHGLMTTLSIQIQILPKVTRHQTGVSFHMPVRLVTRLSQD